MRKDCVMAMLIIPENKGTTQIQQPPRKSGCQLQIKHNPANPSMGYSYETIRLVDFFFHLLLYMTEPARHYVHVDCPGGTPCMGRASSQYRGVQMKYTQLSKGGVDYLRENLVLPNSGEEIDDGQWRENGKLNSTKTIERSEAALEALLAGCKEQT